MPPLPKSIDLYLVWALIALTGYAIFAFGLTTDATKLIFDYALAAILCIWAISLLIRRRLPAVRRFAFFLPLFLLIYGWIAVVNAGFEHNWDSGFTKLEKPIQLDWLPSSINRERSLQDMLHLSVLVGGFWLISDLCRNRYHRRTLLSALVVTGLIFSLVGIFQRASGSEAVLFSGIERTGSYHFASYRYHGNAATFLLFCLPVSFLFVLRTALSRLGGLHLSLYVCAFFFISASLFINTSKMGHAACPVVMGALLILYRKPIGGLLHSFPHRKTLVISIGSLFTTIVAALAGMSFLRSVDRWCDLDGSMAGRIMVYETSLAMIKAGGFLGMGPGTFSTAFPYYLTAENQSTHQFFHYAHQDYLQGLIEWGKMGWVGWLALLFFVFVTGIRNVHKGSFYAPGILAGLVTVAIQSLADFPTQIASLQWVGIVLIGALISPSLNSHRP